MYFLQFSGYINVPNKNVLLKSKIRNDQKEYVFK